MKENSKLDLKNKTRIRSSQTIKLSTTHPTNLEIRLIQCSAEHCSETYQTPSVLLATMSQEQLLSPQQSTIVLAGSIYYREDRYIFRRFFKTLDHNQLKSSKNYPTLPFTSGCLEHGPRTIWYTYFSTILNKDYTGLKRCL